MHVNSLVVYYEMVLVMDQVMIKLLHYVQEYVVKIHQTTVVVELLELHHLVKT
jgi:hypothetical protein